ncbi:MAG: response regulator [Gemmiger formicilis]|uniref:LytR/AlgR family response regulator transcription factor n=1 Tax=Gemmiger formicilis TaxID=745368 RepID=UPI003FEFE727|nr:response regulator [Gemmiger formicilis]
MIRIGIVDDEKQERDQLKQALARFGAENGTELNVQEFDCAAVYLAAQDRDFDILYLDIDMPQMSGMELAEKIRETDQDVILIFCTNLQQFALNGYSVGALGFIVKPIQWYSFHIWLVLTILLDVSYKRGKPDLNILFQYNMPLRALAKMTNGAISMGMVDGIVMELQGFWILGLVRVIYEAIKNGVLNAQMEKRLRGA